MYWRYLDWSQRQSKCGGGDYKRTLVSFGVEVFEASKLAELEERLVLMQPTTAANVPPSGGEMDLQTMQSMEWLFKKERIYLLAQFWQQVSFIGTKYCLFGHFIGCIGFE